MNKYFYIVSDDYSKITYYKNKEKKKKLIISLHKKSNQIIKNMREIIFNKRRMVMVRSFVVIEKTVNRPSICNTIFFQIFLSL